MEILRLLTVTLLIVGLTRARRGNKNTDGRTNNQTHNNNTDSYQHSFIYLSLSVTGL